MTDQDIETYLYDLIADDYIQRPETKEVRLNVETFLDGGIMTNDKGLTITDPDGNEWQVTIVRSK